nr:hypothetical protein [Paeniglutamicibacter cryotolerans]
MHCPAGTVVPGVHGTEEPAHLRTPALTDHQPVRPHAQRLAQEHVQGDHAGTLDVAQPGLQPDQVPVRRGEFTGVLHHDDAFGPGDGQQHRGEQRGLAAAGAATDEEVHPGTDDRLHGLPPARIGQELVQGAGLGVLDADGEQRASGGQRRQQGMDTVAIQHHVGERCGVIEPAPPGSHQPHCQFADGRRGLETGPAAAQPRGAIAPYLPVGIDQHVGGAGDIGQGLQRTQPEHRIRKVPDHAHGTGGTNHLPRCVDG